MELKRNDVILILLIFTAALCFHLLNSYKISGGMVKIYSDGVLYGEYPLSENISIEVINSKGGANTVVIKDGHAFVSHASCSDKVCVKQGHVSKEGASVVCIPNMMSVKVDGSILDGITR